MLETKELTNITKDVITYQSNDGNISFQVNVFEETVWLNQKQMAELFDFSDILCSTPTLSDFIQIVFEQLCAYAARCAETATFMRKKVCKIAMHCQ